MQPHNPNGNSHGKILIVDDSQVDASMLRELLTLLGHTAYPACDGIEALEMVKANPPDLILMDVNMPGKNGYEVCKNLKLNPELSTIPVIFLSGVADTMGITQAFAAGGVDYVTKPYVIEELSSRINTHLKLHFAKKELQKYANHLEDLVIERTWDLRKAHERLKILDTTKNEFLDVIAHELRTPATSVLAVGQLAIMGLPDAQERQELMAIFEKGSQRLQRTIDNALLLARLQTSDSFVISEQMDVGALLDEVIQNGEGMAAEGGNEIVRHVITNCQVAGNYQLAEQCVTTILNVALKMADQGSKILAECNADSEYAYLVFSAAGRTFAVGTLDALFDTFSYERISSQVEELGLSLPISAQIATLFGGKIDMQNTMDPLGIRITLALKRI
jgi:two-component system, sensor histidine kinase and response regulator